MPSCDTLSIEREALEKAWLEMAEKKRIEEERYRQERAQKELDRVRMLDEQKRAVQEVKLREREQEAKLYEQQVCLDDQFIQHHISARDGVLLKMKPRRKRHSVSRVD